MAKIFIAGDVINCHNVDGRICGPDLVNKIAKADYAICNFESVVTNDYPGCIKSGPRIMQQKNTVSALKEHGFDLLLLANNHVMDYGREALAMTMQLAASFGLDCTGAALSLEEAYKPKIIEIDNLKIGIVNACEAQFGVLDYSSSETSGYAWINHRKINSIIQDLSTYCDFIIFCAHAGLENHSIPLVSWKERYKELCDLGVDVVIGSHPHVPQGYEKYGSSYIFYSLGNFFFDYDYAMSAENHSFSVELTLDVEKGVDFELISHKVANGLVDVCDDKVDIDYLNELLLSEGDDKYNQMILDTYNQIIKPRLFGRPPLLTRAKNFKGLVKELVATILGRRGKKVSQLELYHFVRNETYHYVSVSALSLNRKTEDGKVN